MKITHPWEVEARAHPVRGLSARERAAQAAIEKQLSRYLKLSCGHFETLETAERYAFAALSILGELHVFCEKCNDFARIVKIKSVTEYPDNPLF